VFVSWVHVGRGVLGGEVVSRVGPEVWWLERENRSQEAALQQRREDTVRGDSKRAVRGGRVEIIVVFTMRW
jgi:hypothetical protein